MQKNKKLLSVLAGILTVLMLCSLLGNVVPRTVQAASSGELKNQLDDLEDEADELDAQIKELRNQMSDNLEEMEALVNQKSLIDQEISLLYQKQDNLNAQISAYALLIADKQEELEQAEQNLEDLRAKNKARIRAMEENGQLSYWSVLFQASSFMDMLDRMAMMWEIEQADKRCLAQLDQAAKDVAAAKQTLETEQLALQESRDEMVALQAELEERRSALDELLIQMKAKGDEYAAMLEDSEDKQQALMEEIAKVEDAYEDAKFKEWLATSKPSGGNAGDSNQIGGITWLVPCYYTAVTDRFGVREYHPVTGEPNKMHNGIDLAGPYKTPIIATRSGYVSISAYQKGGAGYYVQLNHGDGYKSIYMHMTGLIVKVGQYIEAGQVIGYMGSTGGSTGVHLHFGISYNGKYVNPAPYINID